MTRPPTPAEGVLITAGLVIVVLLVVAALCGLGYGAWWLLAGGAA